MCNFQFHLVLVLWGCCRVRCYRTKHQIVERKWEHLNHFTPQNYPFKRDWGYGNHWFSQACTENLPNMERVVCQTTNSWRKVLLNWRITLLSVLSPSELTSRQAEWVGTYRMTDFLSGSSLSASCTASWLLVIQFCTSFNADNNWGINAPLLLHCSMKKLLTTGVRHLQILEGRAPVQ